MECSSNTIYTMHKCTLCWFAISPSHRGMRLFKPIPGTLQSSNMSSQVLDPRIPSLSSFCAVWNPSMPCRTKTKNLHSNCHHGEENHSNARTSQHNLLAPSLFNIMAIFWETLHYASKKVRPRWVDQNLISNSLSGFHVSSYHCTTYCCLKSCFTKAYESARGTSNFHLVLENFSVI